MIFSQPGIHAEEVALTVVLLLEVFWRLKPCQSAKIVLANHPNAKVFRFPLLLALLCCSATFRANDDERGLRRHLIRGGTAKADDERLRLFAAE